LDTRKKWSGKSEKMVAMGKLMASLVHEMNTPINTLNSTADTLSRSITHIVEEIGGRES